MLKVSFWNNLIDKALYKLSLIHAFLWLTLTGVGKNSFMRN